ncbi:hypothetical protein O181_132418 [Austropuccinia psidii MF-1]|uniref:Uncharacterized protein n=1 Tax=Austropuccinia psidii MF-1 TaxID=1389203 RepID=A0A9Q3L3S9_9BASI|nr:hypothetical protein [Austropuccinia psidii MF-1]
MPLTRSGASCNPSSSSQKVYRSETATRSLSAHIQSQPEGLQPCIAAQRVPDPCIYVEKLDVFLPECEETPGTYHHLQVTQWKEKHDAFNRRMEEKQPYTTQAISKNSSSTQKQKFKLEKAATSSEKGQRQSTSHKPLSPGIQNPKYSAGCHGKCISDGQKKDGIEKEGGSRSRISEMISDILDDIPNLYKDINDVKSHIFDKNLSLSNNPKANNLNLSQINGMLMCFEKFSRTIKTSNNDNIFGNKLNEQSAIIK